MLVYCSLCWAAQAMWYKLKTTCCRKRSPAVVTVQTIHGHGCPARTMTGVLSNTRRCSCYSKSTLTRSCTCSPARPLPHGRITHGQHQNATAVFALCTRDGHEQHVSPLSSQPRPQQHFVMHSVRCSVHRIIIQGTAHHSFGVPYVHTNVHALLNIPEPCRMVR